MAGHSKWANIKHKKGAEDKKRSKMFSKLAKEIMVAAKNGGPDEDSNAKLRTAVASAKSANMPNDNIDRAIKKGCGDIEGVNFEEMVYEGYGPGGVAILVECLSDNRNRTAGEVRMTFDRGGGNLANNGAVTWMFKRKAYALVRGENADEEKLMDAVLDAGVEDIIVDEDIAEIYGPPESFEDIVEALKTAEIKSDEASIIQYPDNTVKIEDPSEAKKLLSLIESLEDLDDVQSVHSNADIPRETAEKID